MRDHSKHSCYCLHFTVLSPITAVSLGASEVLGTAKVPFPKPCVMTGAAARVSGGMSGRAGVPAKTLSPGGPSPAGRVPCCLS